MTFNRNSWKRSRNMQSIYDFFVRKDTQFQKRLQIDAKLTQDTDNCKWLGKRNQRNRHTADIIRLSAMKSHASYEKKIPPYFRERESWETKRRLLVHNIDLCDLSSSLIRDYTKWPSDKFRDYDEEFFQRLRQSHIRPMFDVGFFFKKKSILISKHTRRVSPNLRDIFAEDVIYWHSSETTHRSRRNHIVTKMHCTIGMMTTKKIKTVVLITNVKMRLCLAFRSLKSRTKMKIMKIHNRASILSEKRRVGLDNARRGCRSKISWSS